MAQTLTNALTVCSQCQGAGSFGAKLKRKRICRDSRVSDATSGISARVSGETKPGPDLPIEQLGPMSSYDTRHSLQAQPRNPCPACDGCGLVPTTATGTTTAELLCGTEPREEMSPERRRHREPCVAIIGGGLGGLALALALQHRGIPCVVLERDGETRVLLRTQHWRFPPLNNGPVKLCARVRRVSIFVGEGGFKETHTTSFLVLLVYGLARMDARAQGYGLTLQQVTQPAFAIPSSNSTSN
jgi:hypothetical protein